MNIINEVFGIVNTFVNHVTKILYPEEIEQSDVTDIFYLLS